MLRKGPNISSILLTIAFVSAAVTVGNCAYHGAPHPSQSFTPAPTFDKKASRNVSVHDVRPDSACGSANYCGYDSSVLPGGWYCTNCQEGDIETWYVRGLSSGIATYTIIPPKTDGMQATTITITVAATAPVGIYSFYVGSCNSSNSCGSANATLVVTPELQFNGAIINDTTQQVVVGQQIPLSVLPPMEAAQWELPGNPIGGYSVGPNCPSVIVPPPPPQCMGKVIPLPDLTQSTITFYWSMAGSYTVTYNYLQTDGTVVSVQATFNVVGPTSPNLLPGGTRTTVLLPPPPESPRKLSCGSAASSPLNACVVFFPSFIPPAGYESVQPSFVQLISFDIDDITASTGAHYTCSGNFGLDNDYPYSGVFTDIYGRLDAFDTPGWPLSPAGVSGTVVSHEIGLLAQMFLMWNSGLPNAIVVPLGSTMWSWQAGAELNSSGEWVLKGDPVGVKISAFNASSQAYPEWDVVALNHYYQCNPSEFEVHNQ
jgi:hypothetical protein